MKILIVSREGDFAGNALRLSLEGNDILLYIEERKMRRLLTGFPRITHIEEFERYVGEVDAILVDSTGYGKQQDAWRWRGLKVIGGSELGDKLELDRDYGQKIAKNMELVVPPSKEFHRLDDLEKYIRCCRNKYVLKTSGQDLPSYSTFVSDTTHGEDVIEFARMLEERHGNKITAFELSLKVEGIEVAIGAYFDGKRFLKPFNINFEHKRIGAGHLQFATLEGVGFNTGELGTVMFNMTKETAFSSVLTRFEPMLREVGHIGMVDINTIVTKDAIYFLEWTCRFGYPATMIEQQLNEYTLSADIENILNGRDLFWKLGTWAVGVVLCSQGFPYEEEYEKSGMALPIMGIRLSDTLSKEFHPWEVELEDNRMMSSAGIGATMVATAAHISLSIARQKAYNNVKRVKIPNMYYRVDIGERVEKQVSELYSWQHLK